MTTQPHTHRFFAFQIARAIGLLLLLASALFAALLGSLSSAVVETAAVQAAPPQVQTLEVVAQPNAEEFICRLNSGEITFTATLIEEGECEPYAVPSAIGLDDQGVVFADNSDIIHSVALADVDGDGDLDIATSGYSFDENPSGAYKGLAGPFPSSLRIYTNQSGLFSKTVEITELSGLLGPTEIAWGDIDNDGDLDLATATLGDDFVYVMEGGRISYTILLTDTFQEEDYGHSEKRSNSVAWGDIDDNGKLELLLGNHGRGRYSRPITETAPLSGFVRIYSFGRLEPTDTTIVATVSVLTPTIPISNVAWVTDLAWADYDDDNDLDLVVGLAVDDESPGDRPLQIQIYKNMREAGNVGLATNSIPITESHFITGLKGLTTNEKSIVAPADFNHDGLLDLAIGTNRYDLALAYHSSSLCPTNYITIPTNNGPIIHSLAWGDVDGDGDLDLAAGFQRSPDRIYLNQKGCINPKPVWISDFDSDQSENGTRSLAWGDMDNDGDLDLVAGGFPIGKIYFNNSLAFKRTEFPFYSKTRSESIGDYKPLGYVTLGDIDNDDDLDVARNVYSQPVEILLNQHGKFDTSATITVGDPITNYSKLMFGYINDDNFVDLYVTGQLEENSKIYLNNQGRTYTADSSNIWNVRHLVDGSGVGDIDNDERLELVRTAGHEFYFYSFASTNPVTLPLPGNTPRIAELGDLDNDGDLDIATTNIDTDSKILNQIYIYETNLAQFKDKSNPFGVSTQPIQTIDTNATLRGIAWGDMNGDGYLDLAVATNSYDHVYLNQNGKLQPTPIWTSFKNDTTARLAWGDVDGDGDLDLATGNTARIASSITIYRVYRNDRGMLHPDPAWESDPVPDSTSIAWGDLDNDGISELVTPGAIYKFNRPAQLPLTKSFSNETDPRISVAIDRFSNPITPNAAITALAIANFHAMPFVREQPTIPVTFTLFHPLSQNFDEVRVYYSLNGGSKWSPAVNEEGKNELHNLRSSPFPTGTEHSFVWDVLSSNIFGQYQDVVIRIEAYPSLPLTGTTRYYTNSVPTIATVPFVASQTYPFRLQGRRIQVVREDISGAVPVAGALVYSRTGSDLGKPLGGNESPFVTDKDGYLQGRGEIYPGDYLLALAPMITYTEQMTWAKGLTDTLHVYQTNGSQDGDLSCQTGHRVTAAPTEVLTVTTACPLVLHDLDISLEWDASKDPRYLEQLQFNLKRASDYLYHFTRGQMALRKLNIFQDADLWGYSHINIHANNRLRPYAVIGGVTMDTAARTITHETGITETRTYSTGQLHMGAVWNRYGEPNPNPGDDWSLVFAHELGHYLLFMDDTYIGLTSTVGISGQVAITEPVLIKVDDCIGSAMGDVYTTKNHSFIYDENKWKTDCAVTLANLQLNSTEWETINYWYPMVVTSSAGLTTDVPLSYTFSSITVHDPFTSTTVLANQDFYLKYENGEVGTSEARAFVVRHDNSDDIADYIFDLGSPIGTQNLLRARGVQPGDELCVFDRPRQHFGCEIVTENDEEIQLYQDQNWNPVVQVTPSDALNYTINVTNSLAPTLTPTLQARIFPEYGEGSQPVSLQLSADGQSYSGTITLTALAMAGHVQIVNTKNYTTQQAIVAFSVGGNPGDHKIAGGGERRAGGGNPGDHKIAGGGSKWSLGGGHGDHKIAGGGDFSKGEAPFVSPDGQMIFFATNVLHFDKGEFYLIQDMAGLPVPPADTVAIGRGHNLINSGTVTDFALLSGSISFQYSGLDVLIEKVEEESLNIHYWHADKSAWEKLATYRDPYFNLVSARGRGAGIYALFADRRYRSITDVVPRSVAPGDTITITGNNFRTPALLALVGNQVMGSHLISSTLVDTTTLQVTLPDHVLSGVYHLEVINADMITGTAGITLTVTNE